MTNIDMPSNTTDLINGLFVTLNTTNKSFDYCNAYELLPQIQKVFYDALDQKYYNLKSTTMVPSKKDLDILFTMNQILGLYSIGLNKSRDKVHIHCWLYNLHSFNESYNSFKQKVAKDLKKLSSISQRNEFGVKLVPCHDDIDKRIRDSNYNNQVIVDYIAQKDFNTLMNYLATKNDHNFIYFY
jgi:hypothetical protein